LKRLKRFKDVDFSFEPDGKRVSIERKTTTDNSRLCCSEGFVNKTDDYADDSPLDEVSPSLHQSEFQPDVQVHVVVQPWTTC
jgi:hypothetical protein